jgi:citrate lyase subunit beta / citryl-CoA lyase
VNAAIADARTFLFVPGARPDRFGKAAASGADIVILDLEDAISPDHKVTSREQVSRWLERHQAVIRINAAGTPWHKDDVAMVTAHPDNALAVMVPKAEDGSLDLAAQLGVDHRERQAVSWARSALVLAAAAAGCAAPIDGVTTDLADQSLLRADLDHAVALGFTSKLCIHPSQVAVANRRLTPASASR